MRSRKKRVETFGSPTFTERPSIPVDGKFVYRPAENEREGKYLPFNRLQVVNSSGNAVDVDLGTETVRVPSSSFRELGPEQIPAFRGFEITNLGGSQISKGDLVVESSVEGATADSEARENKIQSNISKAVEKFIGVAPRGL